MKKKARLSKTKFRFLHRLLSAAQMRSLGASLTEEGEVLGFSRKKKMKRRPIAEV